MNIKKTIAIMVIVCFFSQLFGQTVIEIEPYTQDNIPSWAQDARRMSIITFGSIPFTTLTTTLGYTVFRYVANGFDSNYIPNPFPTSSTAANLNTDEQVGILVTAVSLSVIIGIIDYVVIKTKENKEAQEQQKERAETVEIRPLLRDEDAK